MAEDLIKKNALYASDNYVVPPTFPQIKTQKATAIISCMDPRVVPEDYFRFGEQKMAVIRNAGGHAPEALRSLLFLEEEFAALDRVVIVHHTDCGLTHVTDDRLREHFASKVPSGPNDFPTEFGEIDPDDLETNVKQDVAWLKKQPYFSKDLKIIGMLLDLKDGKVKVVE